MKGKIIALCVLALVTIPVLTATANEIKALDANTNRPIITGPTNGIITKTYEYKVTYIDPQGDDVYYKIIWGDCKIIMNDGPHKSGEEVVFSHKWCEVCTGPGEYTIRVQATDDNGQKSNWGTLDVTMHPFKIRKTHNLLLMNFLENLLDRFPILEILLVF